MKPPKLKPGDTVAIISPSNTIANQMDKFEKARLNFEKATGLRTIWSPNAKAQHYYSAGTAQQRVDDFHWALKNDEAKAILFSYGGNTAIELVQLLDYELIKQYPKILSGISDATTLLTAITAKTGLITFLGFELHDFAEEPMTYEIESIKKSWFDGNVGTLKPNPNWRDFDNTPTSYQGWQTICPGKAEGQVIGGNFGSFAQLYHTEYMPKVDGGILFMELYKQPKRKLQQCLTQLKLWGAFDKITGLVMGYNLGNDNPEMLGDNRPLPELVLEATDGYDFPIMWIGEVGHNVENIMLPIGARIKLDATSLSLEIAETVTE